MSHAASRLELNVLTFLLPSGWAIGTERNTQTKVCPALFSIWTARVSCLLLISIPRYSLSLNMPAKRKADLPSSPPSTKRKTRSGGDADVFVPLFDWDEPPQPLARSPQKRKNATSNGSLLKQRHGASSTNDAPVSELAPTEIDEDNGSVDDLDVLRSRPITLPLHRPHAGVASSSRTSSAGSPVPITPTKARNRPSFLSKSQSSQRFITDEDEDDEDEEEEPVSPTKAHRSIRPLPSRSRPHPLSTSSAASDQSEFESPLKVSVPLKGKGKSRELASSGSEGFVEELIEAEIAADDEDEDAGVEQSPSKRAGLRLELGPLSPGSHRLLDAQRKAILQSLLKPPVRASASGETSKHSSLQSLVSLLQGSTERGEGNSCLVLGPRGSGKSRVRYAPLGCILSLIKSSPIHSSLKTLSTVSKLEILWS